MRAGAAVVAAAAGAGAAGAAAPPSLSRGTLGPGPCSLLGVLIFLGCWG